MKNVTREHGEEEKCEGRVERDGDKKKKKQVRKLMWQREKKHRNDIWRLHVTQLARASSYKTSLLHRCTFISRERKAVQQTKDTRWCHF